MREDCNPRRNALFEALIQEAFVVPVRCLCLDFSKRPDIIISSRRRGLST